MITFDSTGHWYNYTGIIGKLATFRRCRRHGGGSPWSVALSRSRMFVVDRVHGDMTCYFCRSEHRQRAGAGAARVVVAKPGQDRYCTCCKSLHFFGGLFLNKSIPKTNWTFTSFIIVSHLL